MAEFTCCARFPVGVFREVTSQTDWPTYNGDIGGNRFTKATQIDKSNVKRVAPLWMFTLPNVAGLQMTPLVVDGVMYVTRQQRVLCARCRHRPSNLALPAAAHARHYRRRRGRREPGSGLSNGKIFMNTDNAHLIALDRSTGALLWDSEVADSHFNYSASSAPLAVGDLVITGTAGGEEGARGVLAAFDQATGKEVWRFWTVPGARRAGIGDMEG